jgi:hypothetical protein
MADDYITQWKAEMGKFLEAKGYSRKMAASRSLGNS